MFFAQDHILQACNSEILGIQMTLAHLATLLEEYGKTLDNFSLPTPLIPSTEVAHELDQWNPLRPVLQERSSLAVQSFNAMQLSIYNHIQCLLENHQPFQIFIDGKAGCGKTTLMNAICDNLHSKSQIAEITYVVCNR